MNTTTFTIRTSKTMELIDITSQLSSALAQTSISDGICVVFNPHTTAGLTINEGADPDVCTDIIAGLKQIVPLDYPFRHLEGNSPAHLMASLMGSSLTIFITNGRLQLGTWQKVFFAEFDGPRSRKIYCRFITEGGGNR